MKTLVRKIVSYFCLVFTNQKTKEQCETYLKQCWQQFSSSCLELARLLKNREWKALIQEMKYYFPANRVFLAIRDVLTTLLIQIDSNVKAYFLSRYKFAGFLILVVFYPLFHFFHLIIPQNTGIFISEYYPDLYYYSFAIQEALKPIIVIVAIILSIAKGNNFKYLLLAPLAFYISKGYYILTATSNLTYLHPPLDLLMVVLVFTLLFVCIKVINKVHRAHTENKLHKLISLLRDPGIAWEKKEVLVQKIVSKLDDSKLLPYRENEKDWSNVKGYSVLTENKT